MNMYSLYCPPWTLRTASKSQGTLEAATENEESVNCFLQRSNFLNASLSFGHVHDAFTIVQSRFFFSAEFIERGSQKIWYSIWPSAQYPQ